MFRFFQGLHPVLYMMIAVVSFSVIPVLIELGDAEDSPFLFTSIQSFAVAIGVGAVILRIKRKLLLKWEVIEDTWSHCKTGLMLVSVIGYCGFVLFSLGLVFVDVSIAAILYATSPLFLMLLMSFLFKDSQRYRKISVDTVIFAFVAIAGVALVILSQNDTPQPLLEVGNDFASSGTLLGAFLVLMAAIGGAVRTPCTLKLGSLLADKYSDSEGRETGEFVFATVMTCIALLITGGVLCVIGFILSETISWNQLFYAIMGGFFVSSIGIVALRAANLTTDDLGVNALAYAAPLVTLVWLWMLSILDVPHLDYLVIGAMGIVASNLLINAVADKRIAYSALVVSLWVFGTIIYFHEGYETDVPLELPVTVFILVLAFRVDRLARRTSQEEEWVFEAFHKLRLMAANRQIDYAAGETLLKIDRHKTPEQLAGAYRRLVGKLAQASKSEKARTETTEIRRLVDNLAHSRQQGAHFGELVAIFLVGGLIVGGLLFFNGDRGFYSEITSFLLSSVVVFLFFNIVDLQNDRRDSILIGRKGRYEVKFDSAVSKYKQQRIAVVVSAVIVVVFGLLFAGALQPA